VGAADDGVAATDDDEPAATLLSEATDRFLLELRWLSSNDADLTRASFSFPLLSFFFPPSFFLPCRF